MNKSLFKREWCCRRHRWAVCSRLVLLADCRDLMLDWATIVVANVQRHWWCRHLCCCCHSLCHYYCCHSPRCSDSNCWATTTSWMQTNGRMLQHLDRVSRPTSPGPEHSDTNDMVMVFEVLRRPLGDSINRRRMVVLLAVLGQKRQLPRHTAMRQCTVDHRIIFGMQHNCLLRPVTPNRRPSDVSILFCQKKKKKETERKKGVIT